MRVVVVVEADDVNTVIKSVADSGLNIVSINEQVEPKVQLHPPGYRGDVNSQSRVVDAVRSQTAPAVTNE